MNDKKLIVHLIREELRNKRFMHSLEDLGLDCSFYTLSISHVILELVGFRERPDELYEWYFEMIEKALAETTFRNLCEMLDKWSVIIYKELLEARLKTECAKSVPCNRVV